MEIIPNKNTFNTTFKIDLTYILPSQAYTINNFTIKYIYNYQGNFKLTDNEKIEELPYVSITVHIIDRLENYEIQSFSNKDEPYIISWQRDLNPAGIFTLNFNFRSVLDYCIIGVLFKDPNNLNRYHNRFTYVETSYV